MIKVYSGVKGLTVMILIFVGISILWSVFIWGATQVSYVVMPLLQVVAGVLLAICVFGFMPLSLVKNMRPRLSLLCLVVAQILSAVMWAYSFLFVISTFGGWGMFFILFLQLLAPIAIVGALMKEMWGPALFMAVGTIASYGMKLFSAYAMSGMATKSTRAKGDIIDVEIVSKDERSIS